MESYSQDLVTCFWIEYTTAAGSSSFKSGRFFEVAVKLEILYWEIR